MTREAPLTIIKLKLRIVGGGMKRYHKKSGFCKFVHIKYSGFCKYMLKGKGNDLLES